MYRIKHGAPQPAAPAPAADDEALTSEIERTVAAHDETQQRWLSYELDAVKSLEYPLMSDMREQVTVDFHRARRAAEDLRPDDLDALRDRGRLDRYRDAVREMQVRFDVAEREAKRRRASTSTTSSFRSPTCAGPSWPAWRPPAPSSPGWRGPCPAS